MENLLRSKGLMLVLSSPSGAGKSSLAKELLKLDSHLELSVSITTRQQRIGEVEGSDYYFVDEDKFKHMIAEGKFFEYANVYGNYYGTLKEQLFHANPNISKQNIDTLFDIDWQGARSLKEQAPDDVISIYILPPSLKELERRLKNRQQDSDEIIESRMSKAISELNHYTEYDYVIINENFSDSLSKLQNILKAERLKRKRQTNLSNFIKELSQEIS